MKPTLTFGTEIFTASPLGTAASVPDLNPDAKFQYAASPFPDEDDEIREGYGRLYASYPYRQYTGYRRTLANKEMATAVLTEHDITVIVDFHSGDACATAYGCDLTHDYVTINGDYRS